MRNSDQSRKMRLAWVALTCGVLASGFAALWVEQGLEREAERHFAANWLLAFDRPPIALTDAELGYAPWATLAAGLALSGLLFGLLRSVFNTRADALRMATELTAEIRQSQRLLQESHHQISLLLDSSVEAIYGIDLNGNCTFCNKACLQLLGYQHAEELLGKNMHRQIHAKQADGAPLHEGQCRILEASRQATTIHVDDEVLWRRDGTAFPVEYWAAPQHHDGAIVGAVVSFLDLSERRRMEQALRVSEERLRIITDAAPDAIIMLDGVGDITFWNPAANRIFGYTEDEALGRNLHALLAPESYGDIHRMRFLYFQQTGQGAHVDHTTDLIGLRKDGSEVPLAISLSAVRVADSWHAIGILRDITKRKQLQDIRAQREAELRTTLYGIGDAVISVDDLGRVLLMNPMAETLTGWSEWHAQGKSLDEVFCIVDEKTRAKIDNPIALISHQFDIAGLAKRTLLIARDGAERAIGGSVAPILDEDGKLARMVIVFHDLTEEKRLADIVRDQLAIIETYDGLVALADLEGKLLYINAGGIKLLQGAHAEATLPDNIKDFCPQATAQQGDDDLIASAIEHAVWSGESTLQRLDGTEIPVAHRLFAIRDAEGSPKHIGVIIMDMSLQKAMQARLIVAEKLAAMGRILADVSHEINNPLAVVIGGTELILRELDEEHSQFKDQLTAVLRCAQRCNSALSKLLAYSAGSGEEDDGPPGQSMNNEQRS